MPKVLKRKRKTPVTSEVSNGQAAGPSGASSKPQSTRTVIRRFHVLIKRQAQLTSILRKKGGSLSFIDVQTELVDVEREIEELGGLQAYQKMSSIGQGNDRGGGSEKVLIEWLKGLEMHKNREAARLRLLEVGALKPDNYSSCSAWIDVTPIDLHSRHPSIMEQDLLLMDEDQHRGKWDIISLSLVMNFVPDAKDRGRMLRLAHSMLCDEGLLFVVLPLPCILNSRYMTPEHFDRLIRTVGFTILQTRWKAGGKMAYWLLRRTSESSPNANAKAPAPFAKKVELRSGNRNNFAILL
ncbi:hypothetical protein CERSUDRAFT_73096 [Gelatoporia subvermispora B]|uniref:25S rRNA adenine-N(1) methyltransferase n=1 Tax=Ceriporiopsis subvermispora (strain B) TaxID=914234 RepID=M2PQ26_CERS8|nr:hypothetical protein CERSUDRAFT_73096 [Gelatoporia subvermispora B]